MARRSSRKGAGAERVLTLGLVLLALLVGAFVSSLVYRWTAPGAPMEAPASPPDSGAGADSAGVSARGRIRVEVLNAARVPGLADRMTERLRSRGFDVVSYDNASSVSDTTLILDRTGNEGYAREVALALPGTPIRRQLSRDRFVDVSVIVGRDYDRFFREGADLQSGTPRPVGLWRRIRSALGF